MYRADIAIQEDFIVAIGDLSTARAECYIDATDQYITPGFIDVNNHSDTYWQLLTNPDLESLVHQGITTIIGGNSGASLAPLTSPNVIRSIQKWTDIEKITFNWLTIKEFLRALELRRPAVNFATLVGHGTMRRGVMYDKTRAITPDEIESMQRILRTALQEGAIGLSTGLKYTHARGVGARELLALSRVVASEKGVYVTYVRDEEEDLVKAVEEAIDIARQADIPLHISHLKAVGQKNWPLMDTVFHRIETAVLDKIDISFDVYPYTTTGSVLYTFLPEWITQDGRMMMLERLKDVSVRNTVLRDMRNSTIDYSQLIIATSALSKMLTHHKISDLARSQGRSPEETVLNFLIANKGHATVSLEALSENNVLKAIQHPFSIISSNGAGYSVEHENTGEVVHPRNFGTFPKVFSEYVRRQKALSWEEAVHKMTGKPATKFQLKQRGFLQTGYFADIVVFHPDMITDHATMDRPYQYATGISSLVINGGMVIEEGHRVTHKRYGQILRRVQHWWER